MKPGKLWAFLILSFISIIIVLAENSPQELNKSSQVIISSTDKEGYDIILDGEVIGKEGQENDVRDGYFSLLVPGDNYHVLTIDDGEFTYGLLRFYFEGGESYAISIDSPEMILGPSRSKSKADDERNLKGEDVENGHEAHQETQDTNNVPPILESLIPDLASPQEVGATIIWIANAEDLENDPIY